MGLFEELKKDDNYDDELVIGLALTYFEDKENIKKLDGKNLKTINNLMYKYCIKNNQNNVALNFASKEYEYGSSIAIFDFLYPYVKNQLDNNKTDILEYDYPYFNYCFAIYYENKLDYDKALEYYKKGASQNEKYCIRALLEYYVDAPECYIEPQIEKIDIDKVLYYAQLLFNIDEEISVLNFNDVFDEIDKLPEEQRKKYEDIIYNSEALLYTRFLARYSTDNRESFYNSLYDCSISSVLKYQKASDMLSFNNNYNGIYNSNIFESDISKIDKLVVDENVEELSKYSDKELFCYGVYYLKKKLLDNAYTVFRVAAHKNNMYAMYAIGLYDLNNDAEKVLNCLIESANLGCLNAARVILYNKKFISQCLDKREDFINMIYEKSTLSTELCNFAYGYINSGYYNSDRDESEFNFIESNFEKGLKFLEKLKKYGGDVAYSDILATKYMLGKQIDFKEYLNERYKVSNDEYVSKIKKLSDEGSNVITIDILNKCNELKQNNSGSSIDLLSEYVDSLPNNTIINIRQHVIGQPIYDLYDINDIKEILKICKNFLTGIDINQKDEDIFMQIYIKLGNYIEYDKDLYEGKIEATDERKITSRNLLSLLNKKGVCVGYAVALKLLLNIMGIESNVVSSKKGLNGDGHSFNQVKINNKWYYCDLTWDQVDLKFGVPIFCLKSQEGFLNPTPFFKLKNDRIYHIALNKNMIYSSYDNYKNLILLFQKNKIKLIKQNIFSKIKKIDMDDNQKVI